MPSVLLVTKHRSGGGTEKHVADVSEALNLEVAYLEDGFWKLYRRLLHNRFDIVHFFLPRAYVLGHIACALSGHYDTIMSRRSLRSCYQTPLIRWIERRLHKRTKFLVGNSPAVVNELAEEALYRPWVGHCWSVPVKLIRNGIKPWPHRRYGSDGLFRILTVANAFPYKGLPDLMEAIKLTSGLPKPIALWLVGRGTEKYGGAGYQDNIDAYLALADLFVLPSHEEGSSNALLEAMAAGVPVIATDVGGNNDAIEHGYNGVLVPPRNPGRLADAICWATKCPEQFQLMADRAKETVAEKFGFGRMIDEYKELYRETANDARRTSKVGQVQS